MIARFPLHTGQVSRLLNIPESQIHSVVRRRLIVPAIVDGRRMWFAPDVAALARALRLPEPQVENEQ